MRSGRAFLSSAAALILVVGCSGEVDGQAHPGPQTRLPSVSSEPRPVAAASTGIVTVVAVDAAGNPAAGWTVEPIAGEVDCSYGASLVTTAADVVFCSPSAAGADVCWVTPDRLTVLCGTDPWQRRLLRYGTGTPVPPVAAEADPDPWAIELADGAHCRIRNGGAWGGRADDLVGAYFCDREGEYVLIPGSGEVRAFDKSGPLWTVQVGGLGDPDQSFPPPRTIEVATAYFAGR